MHLLHNLPAYKKHQYRTTQIVYTANKQLQSFINILYILSTNNDHVTILMYCFYWV